MRNYRLEAVTMANYCSNCGNNAGYCHCPPPPQPMKAVTDYVVRSFSIWLVLMALVSEACGWMALFDGSMPMSVGQRMALFCVLVGIPGYIAWRIWEGNAAARASYTRSPYAKTPDPASMRAPVPTQAPPFGPLPPLPPRPSDGTRR